MARGASDKPNRLNVSGTVSPELHEFLEDYRWTNRKSRSDVVSEALEAWAKSNGFTPKATGEEPVDLSAGAPQENTEAPAETDAEAQPEVEVHTGGGRRARRAG